MAFENIGIGAVFSFRGQQAIQGMRGVGNAFRGMQKNAQRAKMGMMQMSQGAMALGTATAGLAIPLVLGANATINFEAGLSGVRAVTRATEADMERLTERALDLSTQTVFTANEVASSMEMLGRAGFNTNQTIGATAGVLNLAAAEGMGLAEASRLIAGGIRGMGMAMETSNEATESAARVADVLAATSSSATTNVSELGHAMIFAMSQARVSRVSFEDMMTTFGVLADRMVTSSMAGTGFRQMLIRLANPTAQAKKLLRKVGLTQHDVSVSTHGLRTVMDRLTEGFNTLTPAAQESFGQIVFGIRGMQAGVGVILAGREAWDEMGVAVRRTGAAALMARTRLDNVKGVITLIKSSIEALNVTLFKRFLKPSAAGMGRFVDVINSVVTAMRSLSSFGQFGPEQTSPIDAVTNSLEDMRKTAKQLGADIFILNPKTAHAIAQGVLDAIHTMKKGIIDAFGVIRKWWSAIGGDKIGAETLQKIVKFGTIAIAVAAALSPLLLGLTAMNFAFSGAFNILAGGFKLVTGVGGMFFATGKGLFSVGKILTGVVGMVSGFLTKIVSMIPFLGQFVGWILKLTRFVPFLGILGPFAVVIGGIIAGFLLLRRKGESIMETLKRVFGTALEAIIGFVKAIPGVIVNVVTSVKRAVTPIVSVVMGVLDRLAPLFQAIASFLFGRIRTAIGIIGAVLMVVGDIFMTVFNEVSGLLQSIQPELNFIASLLSVVGQVALKVGEVVFKIVGIVLILAFRALGAIIKRVIKISFGIVKVFIAVGKWIGQAAKTGFEFGVKINKVALDILKRFTPIGAMFTALVGIIRTIGPALLNNLLKPIRWAAGLIADLLDGVKGVAKVVGVDLTESIAKLRAFEESRRPGITTPQRPAGLGLPGEISDADEQKRTLEGQPPDTPAIENNINLDLDSTVSVDGREVALANARHQGEIRDRSGTGLQPWQRRAAVLHASDLALEGIN